MYDKEKIDKREESVRKRDYRDRDRVREREEKERERWEENDCEREGLEWKR